MIKARYNTINCWLIILLSIIFFGFFIFFLFYDRYVHEKGLVYSGFSFLFFSFFFLVEVDSFIKLITIDNESKKIIYKNIITRRIKVYDFNYFDGIIYTAINHKTPYKTIGFVKDKKVVRYIDSCWVSNYDKIREFIKDDFTYLGEYNFGTWQQIRLLLRKPVID